MKYRFCTRCPADRGSRGGLKQRRCRTSRWSGGAGASPPPPPLPVHLSLLPPWPPSLPSPQTPLTFPPLPSPLLPFFLTPLAPTQTPLGKTIGAPKMTTSSSASNAMNDFDPVGATSPRKCSAQNPKSVLVGLNFLNYNGWLHPDIHL